MRVIFVQAFQGPDYSFDFEWRIEAEGDERILCFDGHTSFVMWGGRCNWAEPVTLGQYIKAQNLMAIGVNLNDILAASPEFMPQGVRVISPEELARLQTAPLISGPGNA